MSPIIIVATSSFIIGLTLQLVFRLYLNWYSKKQALSQSQDIIETADEKAVELMDITKETVADYERELQEKNAKYFEQIELSNTKRKTKVSGLETELKAITEEKNRKYQKSKALVDNFENLIETKQAKYKFLKENVKVEKRKYAEALAKQSDSDINEVIGEIQKKLINKAHVKINESNETYIEELQENSEREAKRIINISLNRFVRPYCPERGIGFITLNSEKDVNKMLGPDRKNIIFLESLCGVDIIYNERVKTLSVSGFDPVRRELARATLERLLPLKFIDEESIKSTLEKSKVNLLKNIKRDGDKLSRELNIRNVSSEIMNMMGALKYRYSFTQNQYFHCAEVGHLAGLLCSELKINVSDGRRAGLLHDIGKAMDHSLDGGHAVIGADFIEKHGENEKIVHAVRAHHYDETPSTDLAFIVIAADALSGARPGARRSTAVTYMQKMDQLQEIGNSFEGVIDTFILSAGREVRITVDSKNIDDHHALRLSKDIAKKIEQDCNYPGTIKVTVVRESQAVDLAK